MNNQREWVGGLSNGISFDSKYFCIFSLVFFFYIMDLRSERILKIGNRLFFEN